MQQTPTVNEVLNRYAPPARGEPGFLAGALNMVAKAMGKPAEASALNGAFSAATPRGEVDHLRVNSAHQRIISSNPAVPQALQLMESMLQASFRAASGPGATAQAKQNFIDLARQVQADAKVLRSEYRVQGPADPATGGYAFVVGQSGEKAVSLGDAFASVQRASYRSGYDIMRVKGNPVVMMLPAKSVRSAQQMKLP
jgi:hypothetical protein